MSLLLTRPIDLASGVIRQRSHVARLVLGVLLVSAGYYVGGLIGLAGESLT